MIDEELRRRESIMVFLSIIEKRRSGTTWCKDCDFPWVCCPCRSESSKNRVYMYSKEAIEAIGRVIGG